MPQAKQTRTPDMSIKRTLIASALIIMTAVFLPFLGYSEKIQIHKPLSTFPKQIGEWSGEEYRFNQETYDILGVDDSFFCNYYCSDGREVELYIGFYESQREGDLIHSPKNCMPGAGWNIVRTSLEELLNPQTPPEKIKATKLVIEKGKQRQIVLYWFQSRGRFISSEYMQKVYLIWDSIFKNRTDGSFVRLVSLVSRNEAYTTEYTKCFAQKLIPILQDYLPGA